VVIHDDLDLAPQKIRVKTGGSSGGHNGLNDIDQRIGKNYTRVRIGIGHPRDFSLSKSVTTYVLDMFSKEDLVWVGSLLDSIVEHLLLLLEGDSEKFVSKIMHERVTADGI
jgi:PTH1 family peptidyl-tRNA hydrolase